MLLLLCISNTMWNVLQFCFCGRHVARTRWCFRSATQQPCCWAGEDDHLEGQEEGNQSFQGASLLLVTLSLLLMMHSMVSVHPSVTLTNCIKGKLTRSLYVNYIPGVKKSSPPKTFRNIFISVRSLCVKFCKFVGNSYPHISTNFCRFMLIFHKMALIFPRVPIVFTLSSFEYSPRKWKCRFFTINVLLTLF